MARDSLRPARGRDDCAGVLSTVGGPEFQAGMKKRPCGSGALKNAERTGYVTDSRSNFCDMDNTSGAKPICLFCEIVPFGSAVSRS